MLYLQTRKFLENLFPKFPPDNFLHCQQQKKTKCLYYKTSAKPAQNSHLDSTERQTSSTRKFSIKVILFQKSRTLPDFMVNKFQIQFWSDSQKVISPPCAATSVVAHVREIRLRLHLAFSIRLAIHVAPKRPVGAIDPITPRRFAVGIINWHLCRCFPSTVILI